MTADEHPFTTYAAERAAVGSLREVFYNWFSPSLPGGWESLPRDNGECATVVAAAVAAYMRAGSGAAGSLLQPRRSKPGGAVQPCEEDTRIVTTPTRGAVEMTPDQIPDELMAILDRHAGKEHSRTGAVAAALAEILTRHAELTAAERNRTVTTTARDAARKAVWLAIDPGTGFTAADVVSRLADEGNPVGLGDATRALDYWVSRGRLDRVRDGVYLCPVDRSRPDAPDAEYLDEPHDPEFWTAMPTADPDGDVCRPIDVDGEPVVVRAARRLHDEEHADDPPVLATVADEVRAEAGRRGMRGSQVAAELGMSHSVVVRLMQHSTTLAVGELARLARWAGLDVAAVPREAGIDGPGESV